MKTSKNDWLEKVEEFMAQGMTADKAILKVKKEHPEWHSQAGLLFENVVNANFQEGQSKAAAVRKAVSDYPTLHEDWLRRLATGKIAH